MKLNLKLLLLLFGLVAGAVLHPAAARADEALGCYIDTPAYDTFDAHSCFQLGSSSSVAVFKVLGLDDPSQYIHRWSHSSCTGTTCILPISPGQTISVWVQFEDRRSGATDAVAATATYELEPIGF